MFEQVFEFERMFDIEQVCELDVQSQSTLPIIHGQVEKSENFWYQR